MTTKICGVFLYVYVYVCFESELTHRQSPSHVACFRSRLGQFLEEEYVVFFSNDVGFGMLHKSNILIVEMQPAGIDL